MEEKLKLYRQLKQNPSGYIEDLMKLGFSKEEIEKQQRIGILKCGIDGLFKDRYKLTKFGEEQIVAFTNLNKHSQSKQNTERST